MIWQALVGLAYSLAGFGIGFAVGRVTREVHEIKESIVPDEQQAEAKPHRRLPVPRAVQERALGIVLIVLALSSVSVTWYAATEQRRVSQCQAGFNTAFTDALSVRNEIAAQDRQALITLTNALLDPKKTEAERRAAFIAYNATLRSSEARRAQNPLPTPRPCR